MVPGQVLEATLRVPWGCFPGQPGCTSSERTPCSEPLSNLISFQIILHVARQCVLQLLTVWSQPHALSRNEH